MDDSSINPFALDRFPGFLLGSTFMRLRMALHRTFLAHGHDVTGEQWCILRLLGEQGMLSQNEMGERIYKDKATVARALERLEKRGLLSRCRCEQDRRNRRVRLTPEGETLLAALRPIVLAFNEHIYADLSGEEMQAFKNTLLKIGLKVD